MIEKFLPKWLKDRCQYPRSRADVIMDLLSEVVSFKVEDVEFMAVNWALDTKIPNQVNFNLVPKVPTKHLPTLEDRISITFI